MGIINWLFGNKEEVKEEVEEAKPTTSTGVICNYCKREIFQHEKRKKIAGQILHKKCFKRAKKDVFRGK